MSWLFIRLHWDPHSSGQRRLSELHEWQPLLQSSRLSISKGELGVTSKIRWHRHMPGKLAKHLRELGRTPGSLTEVKKAHNSSRGELKNNPIRWIGLQIGHLNVSQNSTVRPGSREGKKGLRASLFFFSKGHNPGEGERSLLLAFGNFSHCNLSANMPAQDQWERLLP